MFQNLKVMKRLKSLRNIRQYGGEWDVNDIGSMSLRIDDGTNREYLFFWPYGWSGEDSIKLPTNKIVDVLQAQSLDEIYELKDR